MQVTDCYIHVNYPHVRSQGFEELSERLLGVALELARNVKRGHDVDYTFEEGTLLQRIVVIGWLGLGISSVAQYHNFRSSVIDMVNDAAIFSGFGIDRFHELTQTTAANDIYKRTTSRDLNRLRRIVAAVDQIGEGGMPRSQLSSIRSRIIHDLAGLAHANPDDAEIGKLIHLLPRRQIPDLPDTPIEAILFDENEIKEYIMADRASAERLPLELRRPRRRFHKRLSIRIPQ